MLGVKDMKGKRLASREQISSQATRFYKELYSSTKQRGDLTAYLIATGPKQEEDEVAPIIPSETRIAMKDQSTTKVQEMTEYLTSTSR